MGRRARYMVLFVTAVSSPALMPLMSSPVVASSPMAAGVAGIAQQSCASEHAHQAERSGSVQSPMQSQ